MNPTLEEVVMAVAKVIEISADSTKSFEDAIESGVKQAGESLENIKSAWIKNQEVLIGNGKITGYRVHLNVTFVLKH